MSEDDLRREYMLAQEVPPRCENDCDETHMVTAETGKHGRWPRLSVCTSCGWWNRHQVLLGGGAMLADPFWGLLERARVAAGHRPGRTTAPRWVSIGEALLLKRKAAREGVKP